MSAIPQWLQGTAWIWIAICLLCAGAILIHTIRRPQKMWIMSVVWPVTALYLGPFAVWFYLRSLSVSTRSGMPEQMQSAIQKHKDDPPTWLQNSIAVFHCGAGCALGDMIAESLAAALTLRFAGEFGSKLILDFTLAYALGIAFQYFTIAPMRGLSFRPGLVAAARADTISIALFQVGMFAWMAVTYYWLFPAPHLHPRMAAFWFMMQIAMVIGSLTALPANAWLIRRGWKEKMPAIDPGQIQAAMRPAQPSRQRTASAA
jgi:hypothetical protein